MDITPAPALVVPDLIYPLSSILDRIDLDQLFPSAQPLEIELGSGDGSFLTEYAAQNPQRNFIGVERLLGRIRKLDRKGRRLGLRNLRGVRIESSYFLKYLLAPHAVAALHVYFPDPWPKRKHRRHRLVTDPFVLLAGEVLEAKGRVYLRTDDHDYFQQMVSVFNKSSRFEAIEAPEQLTRIRTDFEMDFNRRGINTLRASYQLR